MKKYRVIFAIALTIFLFVGAQSSEVNSLGSFFAYAHDSASERVREITNPTDIAIGFDHDISQLDPKYGENIAALDKLACLMRDIESGNIDVYAIIVEGAASPVGRESYNKGLAKRRAEAVRDYLSTFKGSEKIHLRVSSLGENWEAFTREVVANYNRPNRVAVINIITSDLSNDEKEAQLKAVDASGTTFDILVAEYMASARNAAVIRVVLTSDVEKIAEIEAESKSAEQPTALPKAVESQVVEQPAKSVVAEPKAAVQSTESAVAMPKAVEPKAAESQIVEQPADSVVAAPKLTEKECVIVADSASVEEPLEPRKPVVALRTNLLVPALNVGLEVPIGTNWSVGADYYYPWIWPKKDNKNCFELLSWGVEGRYWFGKERTVFDRLQGHSVGLYGYMGYYDIERNFHGHQGEFINIGVDYTYAMAIGKRKSLHLEFSLGIGYIYSQARKYTVIESQGPLISDKITKKFSFFGPTKANVSLVVPIFQRVKPNKSEQGDE